MGQISRQQVVVGLGNPGLKYSMTRHNVGFRVLDMLASEVQWESKFDSHVSTVFFEDRKVQLVKPQTYMNRSGFAVSRIMNFYKLPLENLLVVYDDMDFETGDIRLRKSGGSGGHNGLASIIAELGTKEFPRLRIGVSKPTGRTGTSFVLGRFSPEEAKLIDGSIENARQAVQLWSTDGIDIAMNRMNQKQG